MLRAMYPDNSKMQEGSSIKMKLAIDYSFTRKLPNDAKVAEGK
jgi:hypothetical protein